jgi:hypothetical protein
MGMCCTRNVASDKMLPINADSIQSVSYYTEDSPARDSATDQDSFGHLQTRVNDVVAGITSIDERLSAFEREFRIDRRD